MSKILGCLSYHDAISLRTGHMYEKLMGETSVLNSDTHFLRVKYPKPGGYYSFKKIYFSEISTPIFLGVKYPKPRGGYSFKYIPVVVVFFLQKNLHKIRINCKKKSTLYGHQLNHTSSSSHVC